MRCPFLLAHGLRWGQWPTKDAPQRGEEGNPESAGASLTRRQRPLWNTRRALSPDGEGDPRLATRLREAGRSARSAANALFFWRQLEGGVANAGIDGRQEGSPGPFSPSQFQCPGFGRWFGFSVVALYFRPADVGWAERLGASHAIPCRASLVRPLGRDRGLAWTGRVNETWLPYFTLLRSQVGRTRERGKRGGEGEF